MADIEDIFDERYPLDRWKDPGYSFTDKLSMKGRKGFVTGAAGGLGRNAAAALAQAGADVALVDLPSKKDQMEELASEMHALFGTNVIAEPCDITDPQQVEGLKQRLVDRLGTVRLRVPQRRRQHPRRRPGRRRGGMGQNHRDQPQRRVPHRPHRP